MDLTKMHHHAIWREAILSALGPLSAYLTPQNFAVSTVTLSGSCSTDDDFWEQISRRMDLGRAARITEIVEGLGNELPHSYRHSVHYSEDRIDGVLIVPRLIRERAAGRSNRIPVLRAARFVETPEALLTSELLRLSLRIARAWADLPSAEGVFAGHLMTRLRALEAQQPWASLRARPRGAVRTLASSVKSRAIAGWTPVNGDFDRLADLVLGTAKGVYADPGPIAFLVSEDERYADRVFELLCVGWLISGLRALDSAGRVNPAGLRDSKVPIFSGSRKNVQVRLFYQAGYFSKRARYIWQRSHRQLRAIPDYALEFRGPSWERSVLLDAKNRVGNSDSEIIYKLLGYRENLAISPYLAIGLAPEYGRRLSFNGVDHADRKASIVRMPLLKGRYIFERWLPKLVDVYISNVNRSALPEVKVEEI